MKGSIQHKKSNDKWYPVLYLGKNELTGKKEYKWGKACDTKRQAESALLDLIVDYKTGSKKAKLHQLSVKKTFKEVFEEWKPIAIGEHIYANEFVYNHRFSLIETHIIPVLGDVIIDRIQLKHLRQCFAGMVKHTRQGEPTEERLGDSTKPMIKSVMNYIFEYAIECGLIEENPCKGLKLKSPATPQKVIWSIEDINYFLDWTKKNARYHYYLAFLILATTAMRRGEACELRYSDIDFERKTISVSRSMTKDGKSKDIKTGASGRRTIGVFDMVLDAIEVQRQRQTEICKRLRNKSGIDVKPKPWDHIITNDMNYPLNLELLSHTFKELVEKVNNSGEYYLTPMPLKNFRHCFATHGLRNGINTPDMQHQLGHALASTTHNSYNQYLDAMQESNRNKMENLYFGSRIEKGLEKGLENGLKKRAFS